MKVLIDEGLPQQLRHYLPGHEVATVGYMGWRGNKNGKLLDLAEADGFDVLLTGDQRLPFQQNIGKRKIAVVILVAKNLQLETLEPLMLSMVNELEGLGPGEVVYIRG
jgi:predicted nuclease of predicted toxin-antitoxin system